MEVEGDCNLLSTATKARTALLREPNYTGFQPHTVSKQIMSSMGIQVARCSVTTTWLQGLENRTDMDPTAQLKTLTGPQYSYEKESYVHASCSHTRGTSPSSDGGSFLRSDPTWRALWPTLTPTPGAVEVMLSGSTNGNPRNPKMQKPRKRTAKALGAPRFSAASRRRA